MTGLREMYYCKHCGNLVELTNEGAGELVCCGEPMEKLIEKTENSTTEKHVPFIEEKEDGVSIRVGQNTAHPMEDKHYIKFIEILTNDRVYRAELKPGMEPKADFSLKKSDILKVREWCNVHGLWSSN